MSQIDGDVYFGGPQGVIKKFQHLGEGIHGETVCCLRPDEIAFYAGREFRTFKEFSIAQNASYNIKVVSTKDTIVYEFGADLTVGSVKIELVTGGTEGGSYSVSVPIFPCNTMSVTPVVSTGITMTANGTHTGGTVVDLLIANSGQGGNARPTTASEDYPQGFAASTFYIRITNLSNQTTTGIFRARWEER
jgi:hypothetical protein